MSFSIILYTRFYPVRERCLCCNVWVQMSYPSGAWRGINSSITSRRSLRCTAWREIWWAKSRAIESRVQPKSQKQPATSWRIRKATDKTQRPSLVTNAITTATYDAWSSHSKRAAPRSQLARRHRPRKEQNGSFYLDTLSPLSPVASLSSSLLFTSHRCTTRCCRPSSMLFLVCLMQNGRHICSISRLVPIERIRHFREPQLEVVVVSCCRHDRTRSCIAERAHNE